MPRRTHPKRPSSHCSRKYIKIARKNKQVKPRDITKSEEAKLLKQLKRSYDPSKLNQVSKQSKKTK